MGEADLDPADRRTLRECEDRIHPAEAFAIVGSEPRLAILEELWKADLATVGSDRVPPRRRVVRTHPPPPPLSIPRARRPR